MWQSQSRRFNLKYFVSFSVRFSIVFHYWILAGCWTGVVQCWKVSEGVRMLSDRHDRLIALSIITIASWGINQLMQYFLSRETFHITLHDYLIHLSKLNDCGRFVIPDEIVTHFLFCENRFVASHFERIVKIQSPIKRTSMDEPIVIRNGGERSSVDMDISAIFIGTH